LSNKAFWIVFCIIIVVVVAVVVAVVDNTHHLSRGLISSQMQEAEIKYY
jgi:hypothetical protein